MNLSNFNQVKVLVVGDVMLDQYWFGDSSRISPEAPVPVVKIQTTDNRLGGAANVAINVSDLGAQATLIGLVGNDDNSEKFLDLLANTAIKSGIIRKAGFETLTKLRVVSRNQQLVRLDFENDHYTADNTDVMSACEKFIKNHDVVVISDYAKGAVRHVEKIIRLARNENKIVIVDPKGNEYGKYKNATVITPNYSEFEQVAGSCSNKSELHDHAIKMCEELNLDALLITRSEKGMSLFSRDWQPKHFPAQSQEVYDVTGAGDTVVALLGAAMASNNSLVDAVKIANLGAGIVVSKLGTATVTVDELDTALRMQTGRGKHVTDLDKLKQEMLAARQNNEKIVFTNGCFDLLHSGHIACLREARSKGDRLIVAVNEDLSIKRLKGEGRPVCTLENRIAVLEELHCIDWIIPFPEDTPLRLIQELKPDIYVKGGDYKKEELAEFEVVNAYGGEVIIAPYVEGCSTTSIIESILNP